MYNIRTLWCAQYVIYIKVCKQLNGWTDVLDFIYDSQYFLAF